MSASRREKMPQPSREKMAALIVLGVASPRIKAPQGSREVW
jgi:hypothetical protein